MSNQQSTVNFCCIQLIVYIILLLTSACSTPIKPVATPVALNKQFSSSGTLKTPDQWWTVFQDAALNRLIDQALAQNFTLLATYNRLQQAQAIAVKTGADIVPQVNGTAGINHSSGEGSAGTMNRQNSNTFNLGLAASYEVDLWGRIRSTINAARLDVDAAKEDFMAAAITLTAEIASTWYKLIQQHQQLTILDQQITTNRKNVALLEARYAGGQAGAADVFQQRQLLESVTGNRLTVLVTIQVLENQLAVLVGQSPGMVNIPTETILPQLPPLPDTGLSHDVLQRRPDIRKAYLNVQAADQRIASAIADRFPKLSLSGSIGANAPSLESLFNNWLGTVAGNLLLPIIDGKRRVAEVERNRALAEETVNRYGQALVSAVNDIENSLVQERQQHKIITNLEQQVQLAEAARDRIRVRYFNGAMDFLRVLSADISLQNLQINLLQARQQLIIYRIALYRALAGGFPLPPPNFN